MGRIHPVKVAAGFERACDIAVAHLESVADEVKWSPEDTTQLFLTAKTTLSSKIVSRCHDHMARIAVEAVLCVANLERKVAQLLGRACMYFCYFLVCFYGLGACF